MSRILLSLPLAVAFLLVGCDSSSSSAPEGSRCDGYIGTWALDSFVVQKSGDTTRFRYEYLFAPSSFRFRMIQEGFTGEIDLVIKKDTGALQELAANRLLVAPTASWSYDWKDTTLKAAITRPSTTVTYRTSGTSKIVLEGVSDTSGALTLTCR